jgi:hypothetical protein
MRHAPSVVCFLFVRIPPLPPPRKRKHRRCDMTSDRSQSPCLPCWRPPGVATTAVESPAAPVGARCLTLPFRPWRDPEPREVCRRAWDCP